jgi:hypothetical protein
LKHNVIDVRLIGIHAVEPLVPDHPFEAEFATAKFKRYKSPSTDQILTKVVQAGGKILQLKSISSVILFGIRKNCLISGRRLLLYQINKKETDCSDYCRYYSYKVHTKFHRMFFEG